MAANAAVPADLGGRKFQLFYIGANMSTAPITVNLLFHGNTKFWKRQKIGRRFLKFKPPNKLVAYLEVHVTSSSKALGVLLLLVVLVLVHLHITNCLLLPVPPSVAGSICLLQQHLHWGHSQELLGNAGQLHGANGTSDYAGARWCPLGLENVCSCCLKV